MRYSFKNALNVLTEFAYSEGYQKVTFDHNDSSYMDWAMRTLNTPRIIKIEGKYNYEFKTYLLLHELGHHILRKNWNRFSKVLPIIADAEEQRLFNKDKRFINRRTYIVSSIEEEYKAWEAGLKLATKLEIKINSDRWNKLKSQCLMMYIRYYGKK